MYIAILDTVLDYLLRLVGHSHTSQVIACYWLSIVVIPSSSQYSNKYLLSNGDFIFPRQRLETGICETNDKNFVASAIEGKIVIEFSTISVIIIFRL